MKNFAYILFAILGLSLFSCQDEDDKRTYSPTETLQLNSTLGVQVTNVVQNPTVFDNVLDNSSGFSVQLPVTITLNWQQLVVNNATDFSTITSIKNQSWTDDDIVHFQFPITLVYPDYHVQVVNSQQQYDDAVSNCENQVPTALECIDFNYPIVINTYNSNSQIPGSVTLQNDLKLYNFIKGCESASILSIVYPISMTNASGQIVTIANNTALSTAIQSSIGTCNVVVNPDLAATLQSGTWHISSFLDDGIDKTDDYAGYTFTFAANGTVTAVKSWSTVNGYWTIMTDDGVKKLDLNFDGNTFDEVEEDWRVLGFSDTQIQLKHQSGGGGEDHYLTFTRN